MPAKASQEEQMLLYRLDREVVNLPSMTDVLNESGKLAEREFGSVTIVPVEILIQEYVFTCKISVDDTSPVDKIDRLCNLSGPAQALSEIDVMPLVERVEVVVGS